MHSARIDAFTALEDPDGVWLALLEGCTGERDLTELRYSLSAAGHGLEPADLRAGVDALVINDVPETLSALAASEQPPPAPAEQ